MNIHDLSQNSPPDLLKALAEFESLFSCSLGGGRSYRMTYPAGYLRYLQSLGESCCIASETKGRIVGMIGGAVLRLRVPNGDECPLVFIEEVKLLPEMRRMGTLWPLLSRCQQWALSKSDLMISVVLDETEIKPSAYTGRAGLVPFRELSKIIVLRIVPGPDRPHPAADRMVGTEGIGRECHRHLTRGRYTILSQGAEHRSVMKPVWLVHPSGAACGRLEDRRRVRQVTVDDGSELRPLFLGSFAFRDARAGVELVLAALRHCAAFGFTALRVAVTQEEFQQLRQAAGRTEGILPIPAAVYATGVLEVAPWNLSGLEV